MSIGPVNPVHVPKAAELVADALRSRILRRELVAGDRLAPEAALMAQYGVSRPTLREALRLLEAQELLEIRRGARGGGVIRTPSTGPAIDAITRWLLLAMPGVASDRDLARLAEIASSTLETAAAGLRQTKRRKAA